MADQTLTPALPRAQLLDLAQMIREVDAVLLQCKTNPPVPLPEMEKTL